MRKRAWRAHCNNFACFKLGSPQANQSHGAHPKGSEGECHAGIMVTLASAQAPSFALDSETSLPSLKADDASLPLETLLGLPRPHAAGAAAAGNNDGPLIEEPGDDDVINEKAIVPASNAAVLVDRAELPPLRRKSILHEHPAMHHRCRRFLPAAPIELLHQVIGIPQALTRGEWRAFVVHNGGKDPEAAAHSGSDSDVSTSSVSRSGRAPDQGREREQRRAHASARDGADAARSASRQRSAEPRERSRRRAASGKRRRGERSASSSVSDDFGLQGAADPSPRQRRERGRDAHGRARHRRGADSDTGSLMTETDQQSSPERRGARRHKRLAQDYELRNERSRHRSRSRDNSSAQLARQNSRARDRDQKGSVRGRPDHDDRVIREPERKRSRHRSGTRAGSETPRSDAMSPAPVRHNSKQRADRHRHRHAALFCGITYTRLQRAAVARDHATAPQASMRCKGSVPGCTRICMACCGCGCVDASAIRCKSPHDLCTFVTA